MWGQEEAEGEHESSMEHLNGQHGKQEAKTLPPVEERLVNLYVYIQPPVLVNLHSKVFIVGNKSLRRGLLWMSLTPVASAAHSSINDKRLMK